MYHASEERGLQAKTRLAEALFLLLALLGPIFHLAGFLTRRLALLYADYPRLGFTYAMLAFSAASAAFLAASRRKVLVRLIAWVALLANLGSVAYVGNLWSHDMRRTLDDVTMRPIEPGMVGIVVSPASQNPAAISEMEATESAINKALQQNGLRSYVVVRRTQPISSEEQAERIGQRLRANIVVWTSESGTEPTTVERHVTVLGANGTALELEPIKLMLLMATQHTFTVCSPGEPNAVGTSSQMTEVIAPVATGFASIAVGRWVLAVSQFQQALGASGVQTDTLHCLRNYLGTALLFAERPDLAIEEFELARGIAPDAYAWAGTGNVFMFRREWDTALGAFRQALALDPYNALPYCGVGILLARERNVSQAIASYKQAVALQPTWGAPYALLGLAYELEANIEAARKVYQLCALQAGPNVGLYAAALERAEDIVRHPPTAVPTATPRPTPTPAPVPTAAMYRVQRGDTLKAIADKFGVSVEAIVEINQLTNPNAIVIGQYLTIPEKP